jgi:hypothetical protein
MPIVKIVPMPGSIGPLGLTGPAGATGPAGLDGAVATFNNVSAWTPVVSGTGFAQSSNPATGTYVEMGKLCYVTMQIPFSNVSDFGSAQLSVTLPFTTARHADVWAGSLHATQAGEFYSVKGHYEANANAMSLWHISLSQKDQSVQQGSPITFQTDDLIHLSFLYEIL